MELYCLKCRKKREIPGLQEITMQNGKKAVSGRCPFCNTKVFKFISSKKAETSAESESFDSASE